MNQFQWNTKSVVNNLLMLNAVIYLAQAMIPTFNTQIVQYLGLHTIQSAYFYPHQVITYMFLHGSFTHLFFNMFALWMFGRVSEYDLGPKRFLTFYMICGIGAGLINLGISWYDVQVLTQEYALADPVGLASHINNSVTIGASGAVFGLLLAFGMMHPNNIIMLLIPPIPLKAKYFVIGYGLLEVYFIISGSNPGVAHFAHLGGMLWGFILLKYWKAKGKIYY